MAGVKAYQDAYSPTKYLEAHSLEDLLTAFAEELEALEYTFIELGLGKRKTIFDTSDTKESNKHRTAIPTEHGLDGMMADFDNNWPRPDQSLKARQIFEKDLPKDWNDTSANRADNKIQNWKKIIKYLQDEYPLKLHKSFWFEDNSLYVGDGLRADLPAKGYLTTTIAEIVFRDIHRTWTIQQLIDRIAKVNGTTPYTKEYEQITYARIKKCCEILNQRISEAKQVELKLIVCSKHGVTLDLSKFHILDRQSAI